MAAQIACLNQLPRMAADRNSTYTTSFDFHCILQAKNAHLLFACSCELARVYMRLSPTSRSRVHATIVSRVHATPRPLNALTCRTQLRTRSAARTLVPGVPHPLSAPHQKPRLRCTRSTSCHLGKARPGGTCCTWPYTLSHKAAQQQLKKGR